MAEDSEITPKMVEGFPKPEPTALTISEILASEVESGTDKTTLSLSVDLRPRPLAFAARSLRWAKKASLSFEFRLLRMEEEGSTLPLLEELAFDLMVAFSAALPTTKPPSSSQTTMGVYLSPRSLLSTEELQAKEEGEVGMMEEIDTRE
jgi:hypothetical protein